MRPYPAKSTWCAAKGYSDLPLCFESLTENSTYDYKSLLLLAEGSITPLYTFNFSEIMTDNFTKADGL